VADAGLSLSRQLLELGQRTGAGSSGDKLVNRAGLLYNYRGESVTGEPKLKSKLFLWLLSCGGLIVLCLTIFLSAYVAVQNFSISTGISVQEGPQGLVVTGIESGAPADRAGICSSDIILSIAGRPVLTEADYDRESRLFRTGHPVNFVVRRGSNEYMLAVDPGGSIPLSYFLLSVIIPLAYFGAAIFVQRRRSGYLRANLFSVFCITAAFEIALPPVPADYPLAGLIVICALYLLNGIEFGVTLHFASVFPEPRRWLLGKPWIVSSYYIIGIIFALLVSFAGISEFLGRRALPWTAGQADLVFTAAFLPLWALALVLLFGWSALRYADQSGRREARQLFLATVPWALFVISTAVWDALLHQPLPSWVPEVGTLVLIFYPLSVFSILMREVALERAVLLGLPEDLRNAKTVDQIINTVLCKIESTLYPSRVFFWRRESVLRGDGASPPDSFLRLMHGTEIFDIIGKRGIILDAEVLSFLISDGEKEAFDSLGIVVLVPIVGTGASLIGLVMLSAKKSEDVYTARDKDLLRTISLQASVACKGLISGPALERIVGQPKVDGGPTLPPTTAGLPSPKYQVFISYAHDDQNPIDWLNRSKTYLEPLRRRGNIEIWYDGKISAGEKWDEEIKGALEVADVAVLLIGPYFLASKYIVETEIPFVLSSLESRNLRKMFPVILTYCNYEESELSKYQAFNKLSGPLEALSKPEQDKMLMKLASTVGEVLKGEGHPTVG
jgi:TIR domain-containing protein/PDZ domain-containing protein